MEYKGCWFQLGYLSHTILKQRGQPDIVFMFFNTLRVQFEMIVNESLLSRDSAFTKTKLMLFTPETDNTDFTR